jgi:Ca-activated chloride channel homolog
VNITRVRLRIRTSLQYRPAFSLSCLIISSALTIQAQVPAGPVYAPAGTIPTVNVGGNYMEAQFARLEFAEKLLDEQKRQSEESRKIKKQLLDSGTVSVLDLEAPRNALGEFNKASELLKQQKSKEAVSHLQKAIHEYPKFVSAHNDLGIAYQDLDQTDQAKAEFEKAATLDDKFAQSFVNLGKLALSQKDFTTAESDLGKAATLRPTDAKLLTVLAYAQNSAHEYHHAIETAVRVHGLPHSGMANVHYVGAASAIALKEFDVVERELELFLKEDPTNPLAPEATYNLKVLASAKDHPAHSATTASSPVANTGETAQQVRTFPNSDALKNTLASLGTDDDVCTDCFSAAEPTPPTPNRLAGRPSASSGGVSVIGRTAAGVWKIRDVIDEVAVFFSVTNGGKLVNDLEATDLAVRDNDRPPLKVLQFASQSKLPLRLGLLIDVSGSLQPRFSFEKQAAARFVQGMLSNPSDLAFVAGFSDEPKVTQDFTVDAGQLSTGIASLQIGGGTAIWDAISFACWKLAAYPEKERVAKVLVVLTDGEDNLSRISLKKAIQDAENTGVTVYAISTKDFSELGKYGNPISDADRVLQALTERTGGEAMFPGDLKTLNKTFDKLRDVIRSRYLIAYRPADFQNDGHYRRIRIVATKHGKNLRVHARQGYYAPLDAKAGG